MLLQLILAGALTARAKGWLALFSGVSALAGVLAIWPTILAGGAFDIAFGHWDGPIQLAYHIDGLSFLFALMGAGIGSAVLLYSVGYMEKEKGATRFYSLVLIFIAGLIHLVYTSDLFLVYLSWELVGLCSFFLVGFWYRDREAAFGARKVLTMTHLAGYGLFAAVVLIYFRTGSTLWTDPRVQGAFSTGIFLLILVAAVAKSVQFPLHTWIPSAMAAPTPVSALLHAACYVKAGVYLVARMHSIGPWPASWGLTVSWLGAITLLIGVLFALAQHDLKKLLAFHTVSQIGYMMLGIGLGTPLGIAAGLFHCLNHGLFKGGLFLCAGAVQHSCGTRDMDKLGGLSRKMPHTMQIWLVCAAGIAGVPLFNGFVSKWMLYNAALEVHQPMLALIPWVGSILTVFSFLKATSGVFLGSEGSATEHAHEVNWTMTAGGGILAAGCILLGVAPQLAITYLLNPLLPALGCAPLVGVSWFGLSSGQGIWLASGGLMLGVVALLFGALVVWVPSLMRGAATAGGAPSVFTGGEMLSPRGHMGASDFSYAMKHALAPFYRAFDVDTAWLGIWHLLSRIASSIAKPFAAAEQYAWIFLPVIAVALGAFGWFAPVGNIGMVQAAASSVPPMLILAVGVGISLAGLLLASSAAKAWRHLLLPLALAGGLALGGILAQGSLLRTGLLESASVVALLTLWKTSEKAAARYGYLLAIAISALGMVGGTLAAEQGNAHLALALLLPAIAVKLGLVPLWLWLPLVAESTPAVLAGLVIGVIDVAAFAEVLTLRISEPWLFTPALPWIVLGVASAVVGALLALAQRNIKRLLAFSTVEDLGLIVVAVAFGGDLGLSGALIGATVHALAKALLFASISGPEADGARLMDARGLASRHPLGSVGFAVGALAVLGVPPTVGYAVHWRIFTAVAGNVPLFALLCGAAMLSVAVYARAITLFWWGSDTASAELPVQYNKILMAVAVLLLAITLLAVGVWPRLLGGVA
ncbi:MAG: proton-conducting transporter membrane subunit [Terracidiphilus sp.]|nr:proton-conducting transporter membrane subunit [Terracidiphilus sp.]